MDFLSREDADVLILTGGENITKVGDNDVSGAKAYSIKR